MAKPTARRGPIRTGPMNRRLELRSATGWRPSVPWLYHLPGLDNTCAIQRDKYQITTGTTPELANAAAVFAGTSTISVANAKCFFSPDPAGWTAIQTALASEIPVLPSVNADPRCYRTPTLGTGNEQFVVKQSISETTIPENQRAPSFVFVQYRVPTSPAVIQIP